MKQRIITSFAIVAVVVPALFYGSIFKWILMAFICCGAGIELLSLSKSKISDIIKYGAIILSFLLLLVSPLIGMAILSLLVLLYLSIPVIIEDFKFNDSLLYISFTSIIFFLGNSFLFIYDYNRNLIWVIMFATYLCDIGAYFSGYFFGKNKLNTRISPKKTIEGSIGGYICGVIAAILVAILLNGNIDNVAVFIMCLVLPLTGQIGDLAFSAIKREGCIKDFSDLLPGHGGVLDRIDSLVFNLIVAYAIILIVGVI